MSDIAKIAGALTAKAFELYEQKIYAVTLIAYRSKDGEIITERVRDDSERKSHAQSIRKAQEILSKNQKNLEQMALVYTFIPPMFTGYADLRRPLVLGEEMSDTFKVLVVEFIHYNTMKHPITLGFPYDYEESKSDCDGDIEIFDPEKYYFPESYKQSDEMTVLGSFFEGLNENNVGSDFLFDRAKSTEKRSILFYDAKLINYGSTKVLFREINNPLLSDDDVVTFGGQDEEVSFVIDGVTYDNVDWHYGQEGSEGATEAGCCLHFAVFLIWCFFSDLGHHRIANDVVNIRRGFMKKSPGPGQLFLDVFDGKFWSSLLSNEGNAFAKEYYGSGEYLEDYEQFIDETYPEVMNLYHAPDTWDIYNHMAKIIEERFGDFSVQGILVDCLVLCSLKKSGD